jgi:hypothetical protein
MLEPNPAQEQLRSLRGEMQEQRLTAAEAWKEGCLKIFFLMLFLVVHHPTLGGGMILSNSHMAMDTHKYLAAN